MANDCVSGTRRWTRPAVWIAMLPAILGLSLFSATAVEARTVYEIQQDIDSLQSDYDSECRTLKAYLGGNEILENGIADRQAKVDKMKQEQKVLYSQKDDPAFADRRNYIVDEISSNITFINIYIGYINSTTRELEERQKAIDALKKKKKGMAERLADLRYELKNPGPLGAQAIEPEKAKTPKTPKTRSPTEPAEPAKEASSGRK